eukprot:COSAG04_NODE_27890_length_279_cov_0.577778_1_plen_83_part_10
MLLFHGGLSRRVVDRELARVIGAGGSIDQHVETDLLAVRHVEGDSEAAALGGACVALGVALEVLSAFSRVRPSAHSRPEDAER